LRGKRERGYIHAFKVPRQYAHVLLVEESLRDGEAAGSEVRKCLGSGVYYE
jgi:hypothetical protein